MIQMKSAAAVMSLLFMLWVCDSSAAADDPGIDGPSVNISEVTQETAVVTWTTAQPSSSQVGITDSEFDGLVQRFPEPRGDTSPMVTKHSVKITGLLPDREYGYAVISADASAKAVRFPALGAKPAVLRFRTLPYEAAGNTRFRIDIVGPSTVHAGSDLYLCIYPVPLAGKKGTLDLDELKFDPPVPSIGVHLINGIANADESKDFIINPVTKKPAIYNALAGYVHSASFCIKARLRTTIDTPPGKYVASFSFTSDGVTVPVKHAIEVLPAATKIQRKPVEQAPPIPNMDHWKKLMLSDGKRFAKPAEKIGFGYEGHVWYYDGGRVFLQIGDYLQDPQTWVPAAQNILLQYAAYAGKGSTGWRVFPHGLAMYYWRYGDERMKQGVLDLANKSAFKYGGSPDISLQRETAYILNAFVKAAQLGAPENPQMKYTASCALGHLDMLSRGHTFEQPFYDGLTLEALIGYYEYTQAKGTPDERIPLAVKRTLDGIWDRAVIQATGQMFYQPLAFAGYDPASPLGNKQNELNNLVTPAFAWYWNLTGDDLYRQRGDFLFEHALDQQKTEGFWSGKQFSQNYKATFDYVHYRSSTTPVLSLTDPSNNPRDTKFKPEIAPPNALPTKDK